MKKNVIAIVCAAVLAAAVIVPVSLQGSISPEGPVSRDVAEKMASADSANVLGDADQTDAYAGGMLDARDELADNQEYESGVMLVGLEEGVTVSQLNECLATLDFVATKSVGEDDVSSGYVKIGLTEGTNVEEAAARISEESVVAAAQPNYLYHVVDSGSDNAAYASALSTDLQAGAIDGAALSAQNETSPDDPMAKDQWGLKAVNAYSAWEYEKTDGAVTVAVVDSGVNTNHEDLADRIVAPINFYLSESGDQSYQDDYGHGTHVAGIVAATANNAKGVAGVSYNANIMPVRVTDSSGATDTATLVRGLDYVVERAAVDSSLKVVNISIGTLSASASFQNDRRLKMAIQDMHDAELLVVYAAGNGGASGAYDCAPCDMDTDEGAIGAIAIERNNGSYKRYNSSNYNKAEVDQRTKELSAPGERVLSTTIKGDSNISYYNSGKLYGYKGGTSMAAPHISGIAAMMYAANPDLEPAQVRNLLVETAFDLNESSNVDGTFDYETGYGLVNADKAVKRALATVPVENPTPLATSSVKVTIAPQAYTGSVIKPDPVVVAEGKTLVRDLDYIVTYGSDVSSRYNNIDKGYGILKVEGIGAYKGSRTQQFAIVDNPDNPLAITSQPQDVTLAAGKTATFSVVATGEGLTYRWWCSKDGGETWKATSAADATASCKAIAERDGYQFRCVVTDEDGASVTSKVVKLTIAAGPTITSQPQDVTVAPGKTATFSVVATGEGLSYKWYVSANGGETWKKTSATDATLSFKAASKYDGYLLKCAVTDKYGNRAISEATELTVSPKITSQPQDVTVAPGETATFSVVAAGEGLSYKWYVSANGGETWKKTSATDATLSFKAASKYDGYLLKCAVTDKDGNRAVSKAAKIVVMSAS